MLCGLAVAILLFTIIRVKLEPFVALLLAGLGLALAAGLPVKDIVGTAIKSGDSVLETGSAAFWDTSPSSSALAPCWARFSNGPAAQMF